MVSKNFETVVPIGQQYVDFTSYSIYIFNFNGCRKRKHYLWQKKQLLQTETGTEISDGAIGKLEAYQGQWNLTILICIGNPFHETSYYFRTSKYKINTLRSISNLHRIHLHSKYCDSKPHGKLPFRLCGFGLQI